MIPPGWKEAHIRDVVADLKSGLSRKLSLSDIGLPVIRSANITDQGLLHLSDIKYWYRNDPQGASTENYFLQAGDILVNFINSVAQIGKCALYQGELNRDSIYTTNIFCVRVNDRILPEYFLLLSRTGEYARYIHSITKPAVNQASFTTKDLKRFRFALPPLSEQCKIVDILGDWDQAIALTERRIEAARQRKTGLMQRLLTGRVRFPEFVEKWKKFEFPDLFETRSSRNHQVKKSEYTDIGEYPVVDQGQQLIAGYTDCESPIKSVPVIVFGDHTRALKWVDFPFVVGADGTQLLSTREPCELLFGYYLLHTAHVPNLGYSRHFKLLKEMVFSVPTNKEEQRRITAVLQTCDREIDLFTQKRDALQRQKKGLMQRLLTGRVRVSPL